MPPAPAQRRLTLEALLTHPQLFGLTTATPVQRALCRLVDGSPLAELYNDPGVYASLGKPDPADLDAGMAHRLKELMILSGIRTGKSLFCAAAAVYFTQTVEIPPFVRPGEIPRVSVVSLSKDNARILYEHIVGTLEARPALAKLLIEEPKAESIMLRHPSGRPFEIKIVPLDRAGGSLVSRWSAGCILDEAPRMQGADEGVLNYEDARKAVMARLLPGALLLSVGSPWAPFGPIYDAVQNHWGKPDKNFVIVKAPGPIMNPAWWTAEEQQRQKERDLQVYRTDVLGEFRDPETSLFSQEMIQACTRKAPMELPPDPNWDYVAAMDPATRGNAWTLIVATRNAGKRIVVLAKEWRPQKGTHLSPKDVLTQISHICHRYGIEAVITDQWAADPLRDIAEGVGLRITERNVNNAELKLHLYENIRTLMLTGMVELPPDSQLQQDLLQIKKRVTQTGLQIVLPRSTGGRHADYAPAMMLALERYADDPRPGGVEPGSIDDVILQAQLRKRAVFERAQAKAEGTDATPWWEEQAKAAYDP